MTSTQLNRRLLLIAAESSLRPQLESAGFQVIVWPKLQLHPPESLAALDDAIENLYGYDWIVFVTEDSVRFFLERLRQQGHDVSDLDSLRVCVIGEATATALEGAHVHVDVVARTVNPSQIVAQLATYAGGAQSLNRLNFLLPQAVIGGTYLKDHLEDAGARADVIGAYQTVGSEVATRLSALQSMLVTGSVDAIVLTTPEDVHELGRLFDTKDLSALLRKTLVVTTHGDTTNAVVTHGISQPIQANKTSVEAVAELLAKHFGD